MRTRTERIAKFRTLSLVIELPLDLAEMGSLWIGGIRSDRCAPGLGVFLLDKVNGKALLHDPFLILLFLFRQPSLIEVCHLDELDLFRSGDRRMNSFSSHKFTLLRHDLHALVAEKKVNERLSGIGADRFRCQHDVASLTQHA